MKVTYIKQGEARPICSTYYDYEVQEVEQVKHELICEKTISVSRNKRTNKLRCSTMSKLLFKSGFNRGQNIEFKKVEGGVIVYAVERDSDNHIFAVVNKGRELGNLEIQGDILEGFIVGKHTIQYFTNGKIVILKEV